MTKKVRIPYNHPRFESLRAREMLVEGYEQGVVAIQGLIAHGRGEAFDYLLGEKTASFAFKAIDAAAATLLLAKKPVISVNGNVAALAAEEIVELAKVTNSKIEVNLFYRSKERETATERILRKAGATEVLGVGNCTYAKIPELGSERRRVDVRGIYFADVVLVPLEDGDRTEALIKMGKTVIAVDLNPFSRTAQRSSIAVIDNIIRTLPKLIDRSVFLKQNQPMELLRIAKEFDNKKNLGESISFIAQELLRFAEKKERDLEAFARLVEVSQIAKSMP